MKEAAVSNIPSRKTSWQKNVNGKGEKFLVPNLHYWADWARWLEKQIFVRKNKLDINLQKNI